MWESSCVPLGGALGISLRFHHPNWVIADFVLRLKGSAEDRARTTIHVDDLGVTSLQVLHEWGVIRLTVVIA
jgi:hypothetical protein